jgi:hypothetical protein
MLLSLFDGVGDMVDKGHSDMELVVNKSKGLRHIKHNEASHRDTKQTFKSENDFL